MCKPDKERNANILLLIGIPITSLLFSIIISVAFINNVILDIIFSISLTILTTQIYQTFLTLTSNSSIKKYQKFIEKNTDSNQELFEELKSHIALKDIHNANHEYVRYITRKKIEEFIKDNKDMLDGTFEIDFKNPDRFLYHGIRYTKKTIKATFECLNGVNLKYIDVHKQFITQQEKLILDKNIIVQ